MTETETPVTFTILEDGLYLPSLSAVLPQGEYKGRILRRDGRISDVFITLPRNVRDAIGLKGAIWSIVSDYRAGTIGEDR